MSTTLPLFWDLSSADSKKRLGASVKLIGTLEKFQASFEHKSAESDASSNEDDGVGIVANTDHDFTLDAQNAPDVAYSVRRLVRGLASPRESSRLGFAVALTELLSRVTTVSCAQILALLLEATRMSGNLTGQEERDMLFARLFGLTAIIQSGLLLRTCPPLPRSASVPSTLESFRSVLGALRTLARAKSWLAEAAYWTIGRVMDHLAAATEGDVPWREEGIRNLLEEVFGESSSAEGEVSKGGGSWTPEKIALALRAQMLWPRREQEWRRLWAPTIKHGDVLHPTNLTTLARILRESEIEDDGVAKAPSRAWKPQVHHVWDGLLDALLPLEGSGRSSAGSFQEFFRVVVDESLFSGSASNERKYWGFVIFQRALPRVKAADLPMLFTKNFMRTWINHLSQFDRYLHSFAQQITKGILSVVQKDPTLGLVFILQLTGVHGSQQFDKLTRTKTVTSIITRMSAEGITNYVSHLLEQADGVPANKQSDIQVINARRSWIIEQFAALIRNGAIPKGDEWVRLILDWFIVHGFFIVKRKSEKSTISAIRRVPSPPYSDLLRRQCRERLLSCLADLTQLSVVTRTTEKVQRITSSTSDGKLWVSRAVQVIRNLEQESKHVVPLSQLGPENRRRLERAYETVAWLNTVSGDQREQAEGVELLLQSYILQFYIKDDLDWRDTESLESCIDSTLCLFPNSLEKSDALDSIGDGEPQHPHPEPIDVFVDIIIGCLERGTAFMRTVGNRSFSLLSGLVKDSTVALILSQLEHRDPSELLANSDEEMDDGESRYSENGRDAEEATSSGIEDDESEKVGDEGLRDKIIKASQLKDADTIDEAADEESGRDLDDEQMMAMDDQLALIFKDRARTKKGKEGAQREAIHFKNRIMDLLDIFVRRQPTNPHILQFLVPLLALTFSDEKQVSEKATGLLISRISKLKDVPTGIDIGKASEILKDLHIRARKAHSRNSVAIISRCSLYISRALLHVGAEETVRVEYTVSLLDFTERKASDLNGQFFRDFIERYPQAAWDMRAALLAAPMKAANAYRQGQAYMLLEILLNHLPRLPEVGLQDVAAFIKQLQSELYSALSAACDEVSKSMSGVKEGLKLVLVAARVTNRLAANTSLFVDIWDLTVWAELPHRFIEHNRFMTSAALVGMCKQIIQFVERWQTLPNDKTGECSGSSGHDSAIGNKRKAIPYSETSVRVKKVKKATAVEGNKKRG